MINVRHSRAIDENTHGKGDPTIHGLLFMCSLRCRSAAVTCDVNYLCHLPISAMKNPIARMLHAISIGKAGMMLARWVIYFPPSFR
jgi:hypothetical protein